MGEHELDGQGGLGGQGDRLRVPLDLVLHLMDRQVVDVEGRMVCKVDDVELTEHHDGSLDVTGLLAGPPALVPRYGGRFGRGLLEQWRRLGEQEADRIVPWRIDLADVARLGSGVELSVKREGLLVRQSATSPDHGDRRRRLNDVLQMRVLGPGGRDLGNVLDVRVEPSTSEDTRDKRKQPGHLRLVGIVVGRGRPGSYLGYDRRGDQGPWLVNRTVRFLHRHSGFVRVDDITDITWANSHIHVTSAEPLDLTPAT